MYERTRKLRAERRKKNKLETARRMTSEEGKAIHIRDIKEKYARLNVGERATIKTIQNDFGEEVASEFVEKQEDGTLSHYKLACYNSQWLGMGTCQCASHDPYLCCENCR